MNEARPWSVVAPQLSVFLFLELELEREVVFSLLCSKGVDKRLDFCQTLSVFVKQMTSLPVFFSRQSSSFTLKPVHPVDDGRQLTQLIPSLRRVFDHVLDHVLDLTV